MSTEDEEIWCDCSDDEKYNPVKYKKGTWEPKPDDILKIFDEIKTKKVLELSWKCPGRRSPDSDKKTEETLTVEPQEEEKEEEKKVEVTQFDFDDDGPEPKAVLTPRRTPGSAPKPEKKVARMEKVLKDMMYQRKVQAAEREARKLALAKSPRAPGSPGRARIGSPAGSPRTPPSANFTPNRQSPVRMMGQDFTPNRQSPVRMAGSEFTPNRQSPVRLSGHDFTPNRQSPVRVPGQDFTPNRQSPVRMAGSEFTPNRQSPVRLSGQDFTPNRQSPVRMPGQDFTSNRQSPVRMQGQDFTPNRQSPVRMSGPEFRPNRQSPVRMAGSDFKPNRQSPVRMMGPGEGLATTTLRAPVSADTLVRTSLTEAINTSTPRVESPISKETVLLDPSANETNSGVAKSGTVTPTNPTSPRDINTESTKTSESPNVSNKTPSADAGEDSENPAKAVPGAGTPVSKTQTPVTTEREPEKTGDSTETQVPMDTE